MKSKKEYELLAQQYANDNYIRNYHVKGNMLWFYKSYPMCVDKGVASTPPTSIKYTVNLDTFEVRTEVSKRFMREGLENGKRPIGVSI